MKSLYIALSLAFVLALSGCTSFERKLAADVLTFEYVGDDCSRFEVDLDDLEGLKSWLDFKELSLQDIKAHTVSRILTGDYDQVRKRQMLAAVAYVELMVGEEYTLSVDESDIRMTVSEFVGYVIEAYEIAC